MVSLQDGDPDRILPNAWQHWHGCLTAAGLDGWLHSQVRGFLSVIQSLTLHLIVQMGSFEASRGAEGTHCGGLLDSTISGNMPEPRVLGDYG